MRGVKVTVIGFGNVGRAFVRTLALKKRVLSERYGVSIDIVAVADSGGVAIKPDGFDSYELLKLCEVPRSGVYTFSPYARRGIDLAEVYDKAAPDVHVELTPSNYTTGEPGYSNIVLALRRGAHVVTANKAPIALHYEEIMEEARARRLEVKFGATVMGGTRFLEMLSSMRSHSIEEVEGVLNATTNYILTEMHESLLDFEQALRKAQALGIAEANPLLDVEGVDAAAKLVIISYVIGKPIKLGNVYTESITQVSLRDVLDAARQGQVIKHVAHLDARRTQASVTVRRLPRAHILAQVSGTLNGVRVRSDVTEVLLTGRGGGRVETAHTVLDDVLEIALRWFT